MTFEVDQNTHVRRDESGRVRHIRHPQQPYTASEAESFLHETPATPIMLANAYLREAADVFGLESDTLEAISLTAEDEPVDAGVQVRQSESKTTQNTTTVAYEQAVFGLPVWRSGITVRVQNDPMRVTSSDNTLDYDIDVDRPDEDAPYLPENINSETLQDVLDLDDAPEIDEVGMLVYRYDPESRLPESPDEEEGKKVH